MSKLKLSQTKIDEFANAIGLGDGKSLLQSLAAGYFNGDSVMVEFCPPDGFNPVRFRAQLKPISASNVTSSARTGPDVIGDAMEQSG